MSISINGSNNNAISHFLDALEMDSRSPLSTQSLLFKLFLLNNHESTKTRNEALALDKLLATQIRGDIFQTSCFFSEHGTGWWPTAKMWEAGFDTLGATASAYGAFAGLRSMPNGADAELYQKTLSNKLQTSQLVGGLTSPVTKFIQAYREAAKTDEQATQQSHNSTLEARRQEISSDQQRQREVMQQMQGLNDKDGQVFGELARG